MNTTELAPDLIILKLFDIIEFIILFNLLKLKKKNLVDVPGGPAWLGICLPSAGARFDPTQEGTRMPQGT